MQSEEEYFGEASVTGRCVVCGEILYENARYTASDSDDALCSYECVVKYLDLKQDDDDRFDDCECVHCFEGLSDNLESVTVDGERFCGDTCAFAHNNIN